MTMVLRTNTTKGTLILALLLALGACTRQEEPPKDAALPAGSTQQAPMSAADCDKLPDPTPTDDSAAGRARAVSEGMAIREACKKTAAANQQDKANADLARIREIKEKEQADQATTKQSDKEFYRGLAEGAKQPIKEFKY
jgi:hypothetical protein